MPFTGDELPTESTNRYVFATIEIPDGSMPSIPLLVFEIDTHFSVPLGRGETLNINVVTFLERGFVLCPSGELEEIIPLVTPVLTDDVAFRFKGIGASELFGLLNGTPTPIVEPAIDSWSPAGLDFRKAARNLGEVLVIVGTDLNLDIDAGTFDLAPAARAGTLTAGRVPLVR